MPMLRDAATGAERWTKTDPNLFAAVDEVPPGPTAAAQPPAGFFISTRVL
jgi:hypothetical protein